MTAGYSGTPLAKKLGITSGARIFPASAPADYRRLVAPLPPDTRFAVRMDSSVDVAHKFATRKSDLSMFLRATMKKMRPDAAIWISWPKKASKVPTDITEDVIREIALPLGLVDVKVCAVDATWSGLKLVVRKERR
jgi:hypothetical protein